jgi:hypothetical protein
MFFKKKKFKSTLKSGKLPNHHFKLKTKKVFFKRTCITPNISTVKQVYSKQGFFLILENYFGGQELAPFASKLNVFNFYSIFGNYNHLFKHNTLVVFFKKNEFCKNLVIGCKLLASAYKSVLLVKSYNSKLLKIQYPSNKNQTLYTKTKVFALANYKPNRLVKKSIVRGIAKNPVDHPNGGNSNIKKPFKTP